MDSIAAFISRYSWIIALLTAASVSVPAFYLPESQVDNSIEVWVDSDSPEFSKYREFLLRYGSEEFIVLALEMKNPLSEKGMAIQKNIAQKLRRVDGVVDVVDIPSMHEALWTGTDNWQTKAGNNPFLKNLLLGEDKNVCGILIQLKNLSGPRARRTVIESIEKITAGLTEKGIRHHMAGTPVMNVGLDRSAEYASKTFIPIAVCISIAVLVIVLRSLIGVIAVMSAVGCTVAWTIGLITMTGRSLNMVTVALPSLLFVLGLSNGIHIASRFRTNFTLTGDRREALLKTLKELIRPAVFSSLTTAAGFGSLIVSDMTPVADLGLFAATGILIALVCNLTILPGILSLASRKQELKKNLNPHWSSFIGKTTATYKFTTLTISIIIVLLCAVGTVCVKTEANVLKFFPDTSRIVQDYTFVANKLTGLYTVELDLGADISEENDLKQTLRALERNLSARAEVSRVISITQLENLPAPSPGSISSISKAAKLGTEFIQRFRHTEDNKVFLRMSVLVKAMASSDFYSLLTFIQDSLNKHLSKKATSTVTGVVSLLNDSQKSLINTQVRSFSIAAGIVLLMIGLLFRSLRVALVSILPNLLPVLATFALMATFKIPLDPATVMIASVAIGIAADDTIHFLSCYRRDKVPGSKPAETVVLTLEHTGRAMFFTTIVAAAGFSVLCLTDFVPISHFGILTGVTMITAFAADIIILPACTALLNLWEKK